MSKYKDAAGWEREHYDAIEKIKALEDKLRLTSIGAAHLKSERDIHIKESEQFVKESVEKIQALESELSKTKEYLVEEKKGKDRHFEKYLAASEELNRHKELLRKAVNRCANLMDVLESISKPKAGLDLNDDEEEQEQYWCGIALGYRLQAVETLKRLKEEAAE